MRTSELDLILGDPFEVSVVELDFVPGPVPTVPDRRRIRTAALANLHFLPDQRVAAARRRRRICNRINCIAKPLISQKSSAKMGFLLEDAICLEALPGGPTPRRAGIADETPPVARLVTGT